MELQRGFWLKEPIGLTKSYGNCVAVSDSTLFPLLASLLTQLSNLYHDLKLALNLLLFLPSIYLLYIV